MGPTVVAYLHGAGAGAEETIEATTATAATGMAGALWLAVAEVVGAAAAAAAAVGGGAVAATAALSVSGLDPPTGGGEKWCTRGLKLCPSCVLTMPGSEKERRWREWEEEEVFFAKEEKGFEMKMKEGGVLSRWVRVCERFSPFNVHKWVLKLGLKKSRKSNVLRRKRKVAEDEEGGR